jgi:lipoprotein-anchoring transpeptidase ErfK/SrfK
METKKGLFIVSFIIVMISVGLLGLKSFCMQHIEIEGSEADITLNFFVPMDQEAFDSQLQIDSQLPEQAHIAASTQWLSPSTVQIHLTDHSEIKGQKITLKIQNAPTCFKGLFKKVAVGVQFQEKVEVLTEKLPKVIATDNAFLLSFNTPIQLNALKRNLEADFSFKITPVTLKIKNKQTTNPTQFYVTPQETLANDTTYHLTLKKGLLAQSGMALLNDTTLSFTTDKEPVLTVVYPQEKNKWVGLYPRFIIDASLPIEKATLKIDGHTLTVSPKNSTRAEFLLDEMLEPDKTYEATFCVETTAGEKSEANKISFTTVALPKDRLWLEVTLNDKAQNIKVYQGEKVIKQMTCSGGAATTPTALGTYYILYKQENTVFQETESGANYCLQLTESIAIHGMLRDSYWQPIAKVKQNLGLPQTQGSIVLSEEDALWLYKNMPLETMVVIHS